MTGPSYARPEDDRPGTTPPADPNAGPDGYDGAPAGEPYREEPATVAPEKVPQRTRVSGIWVASIAAVVVLLLLLIFILQNGSRVEINIFGANPSLPLGVALLLAAVLGALLVALIGIARVVQLRHTARRIAKRKSR
jgi:uncharacterized integral membrane protein